MGEIAALIAAIAFLVLCAALSVPILRLRHTVDAATQTLSEINDRAVPMLASVNATVDNVNTALVQAQGTLDGVNIQLERLDTITEHIARVTGNVANLSTVVTEAAASPLGKVAAFGLGLRRASARRRAQEEEDELRARLKQERRARGN